MMSPSKEVSSDTKKGDINNVTLNNFYNRINSELSYPINKSSLKRTVKLAFLDEVLFI